MNTHKQNKCSAAAAVLLACTRQLSNRPFTQLTNVFCSELHKASGNNTQHVTDYKYWSCSFHASIAVTAAVQAKLIILEYTISIPQTRKCTKQRSNIWYLHLLRNFLPSCIDNESTTDTVCVGTCPASKAQCRLDKLIGIISHVNEDILICTHTSRSHTVECAGLFT